ncbi:MAG TPA: UDP-N-acetylglucosamine 2-epimerase (non-hydrolyzing) [Methanothrix sp.]|nr:UDP-N-acetylglucosamine 2-epimerase (non-hydrolyzing) [Methanothrix sp.]HOK59169.1 UDP-N-acetylglucosamine 2-epimerase (non-hydrolyzing) [Methanothrix sp.]HOL44546.1 UDP-N-acetylglucosamine 2-epimerase (non-hydrolyzing) [Methanothrix sp.]HPO89413.1 UDP-N-acetylglucosamine 2-epimerase (non-hydrolyzing) [Methanothrix sp.]
MKVASVVGARPNFIKLAPVSRALRERFHEVIVHTGQHYDYEMDRIFFDEIGIPEPDHHLGVGSGSHGRQTGEMLARIEDVLIREEPDAVVVFGDTNTTLAGALAAAKLHIILVHVEAGLRSYDRRMPEEINRVLVDHCSDILSCPTETAVDNLRREGIVDGVYLTGDVMVDAMNICMDISKRSTILERLELRPKEYILATLHRAENTDDDERLREIIGAFQDIGSSLVFPCHPRTERRLKDLGLWNSLRESIKVIKPVGYLDMLQLESNALRILTDSGGVQKEAYILRVPCVTLRERTEWVETVMDGWNVLAGASRESIVRHARCFVPPRSQTHVFGDGEASRRIADVMESFMSSSRNTAQESINTS